MIILCFVIKVENYAVAETTSSSTKSSMKNSLDDFCTTTINNSLNCKGNDSNNGDRKFFYATVYPVDLLMMMMMMLRVKFHKINLHNFCFVQFTVYASQDIEKDNKSLPLRVFSNSMSSFPVDMKNSKATTSLMQQSAAHRHPLHSRLTDVQICSNEIIDLTSASAKEMIPVNLNAQARPYELTKLNGNNMMNIYDVNGQNLDILQGISKGNPRRLSAKCLIEFNSDSLSTDSIVGIRDNNLDIKSAPPTITLTNSEGKFTSGNLAIEKVGDTDGMLNLISNDLDYLLNRTQEVPIVKASSDSHHSQLPAITPPPPVAFSSKSLGGKLQHEVIIEESEHEVDS